MGGCIGGGMRTGAGRGAGGGGATGASVVGAGVGTGAGSPFSAAMSEANVRITRLGFAGSSSLESRATDMPPVATGVCCLTSFGASAMRSMYSNPPTCRLAP
jgi:hypothetical protein